MKITADDLLGLGIIEKVDTGGKTGMPGEPAADMQNAACGDTKFFWCVSRDRQTVSFWITVTSVSAACNECRNREGKLMTEQNL